MDVVSASMSIEVFTEIFDKLVYFSIHFDTQDITCARSSVFGGRSKESHHIYKKTNIYIRLLDVINKFSNW